MKKAKILVIFLCLITLTNSALSATIYFDDGQAHSINNNTYQNDDIWLDNNTFNDPGTHLELLNGGEVNLIRLYNKSTATINGGVVNGLIRANDDSIVTINNGLIADDVEAHWNSIIFINGGSFTNASNILTAQGAGEIVIRGGSIENKLFACGWGKIYLDGSNFNCNGYILNPGDSVKDCLGFKSHILGRITGTLRDGSVMDNAFEINLEDMGYADIIIIPEPATIFLLTLGGFVLRKKHR